MSRANRILTVAGLLLLSAPMIVGMAALSAIGHRWVDILAQFVAPALVGTAVLAAAALILRLWPVVFGAFVTILVLLVAGGPQWWPPTGRAAPDAPAFSLYSANVWIENSDIDALGRSITAADADIVMLVEVGDRMAGGLDRILKSYPNRLIGARHQGPKGFSRFVLASRFPIRAADVFAEQLEAQGMVVTTPSGPVTVVGVHLTRPWPYQFQWGQIIQARGLQTWRKAFPGPMIVAGDFNSVSSARIGRQIKTETGMVPAPGWPGTWHTALPSPAAITIDQVYRTPDLAVLERRLGGRMGSDHRPVITRFARAAPRPAD